MKNVLITGACGFIGANLVKHLEKNSPETRITAIDDFRSSSFKNLLKTRADILAYNVADPSWIDALAGREIDTVVHLASITDTTVMDQQQMMFDNVEGFRNILDFSLSLNAKVVYASSAATYGTFSRQMTEADAGEPNNIYGFSKWAMENLARFYEDRLEIIGLRFFNVFGPYEEYKGMPSSMVYHLYNQMASGKRPRIFFDGNQKRDFVYVNDIVSAILMAAKAKGSGVCNAGTGQADSFNNLIKYINEAMGTDYEPEYFENPYTSFYQNFTQADLSAAQKLTGYKPAYTTREGVIDYVQNYLMKLYPKGAPKFK